MTKKSHTLFTLLAFIFTITFIEAVGQTLITKNSIEPNKIYYIIGSVIYGIFIPFMLSKSLEYEGMATINLLWNILSIITMTMIGYIIFKETINHLHLISILLLLCSIVLLYFANSKKSD
jgi:multidrug transporter EmrE-like cation transporter